MTQERDGGRIFAAIMDIYGRIRADLSECGAQAGAGNDGAGGGGDGGEPLYTVGSFAGAGGERKIGEVWEGVVV